MDSVPLEAPSTFCLAVELAPKLDGRTVVLFDMSGSMALGEVGHEADERGRLASIINADDLGVFTFSSQVDLLCEAYDDSGGPPWART